METFIITVLPFYICIRKIVYSLCYRRDRLLNFAKGEKPLDGNMWKTGYFYKVLLWVEVETYFSFLIYLVFLTIYLAFNGNYVCSIVSVLLSVSAYWETWNNYKVYKSFSAEIGVVLKNFLNELEKAEAEKVKHKNLVRQLHKLNMINKENEECLEQSLEEEKP